MRNNRNSFRATIAMLLVAAGAPGAVADSAAAGPSWSKIVSDDGTVAESLHGIWLSRGYDWAGRLTADEVELYDVTDVGCVSSVISPEEFTGFVGLFRLDGDVATMADLPTSTHYTFDRHDELPAGCAKPLTESPTDTFRFFQTIMADSYAFFDLYDVDWSERTQAHRSRVTDEMSGDELFDVMRDMLRGLDDGHLMLIAEMDEKTRRFAPPQTKRLGPALRAAFKDQKRIEGFGDFQTQWFFRQKDNLRRKALKRTARDEAGGNVLWGRIGKDVGYVAIYGMGGFADDDDGTMVDEVAAVHAVIGGIVDELSDVETMIVDVSLNQGGYDDVSRAIAAHFAAERTYVYAKQPFRKETPLQKFFVEPAASRFTGPVVLVTSEVTVSAAETFTLAMRALPNVTHVGETTRGALSDILSKSLPNGWELEMSHEIYLDEDGVLWEGRGIPPARAITIFDADDVGRSQVDAIRGLARESRSKRR